MAYKPQVLSVPGGGTGISSNEYANLYYTGINNFTGDGTNFTIPYNTFLSPANSNFNTTTGVYTAPVNGVYRADTLLLLSGLLVTHTSLVYNMHINSTDTILYKLSPFVCSSGTILAISPLQVITLTAGDKLSYNVTVSGGTKVVDILNFTCFNSIELLFGI